MFMITIIAFDVLIIFALIRNVYYCLNSAIKYKASLNLGCMQLSLEFILATLSYHIFGIHLIFDSSYMGQAKIIYLSTIWQSILYNGPISFDNATITNPISNTGSTK